ncbi:ABC transporter substrate-binding protein [Carboxydochorda subterranea]|uniref:ABC transporter substrate-binding protein n=1 Tax=Carboxydichorda subterranea TaxID=3109565 RepID=A0ABZ1BTV9_9FIRM|nr:ABC transporter substrate-binding protein [Limnochorda sp. L945t]WRP16247.1 ABC transporter substrate-binding protein [Limnochorda sp. L945t]
MRFRLLGVALVLLLAMSVPVAAATYETAIFEEPTTLNVFAGLGPQATVWNSYVTYGIYYGMLYGNAAPTWVWAPSLAADVPTPLKEVTEGGTTLYTSDVPIRTGIRWSDGTPFTADDVVFTYDTLLKFDADKLGGNWASYAPKTVLARVEKLSQYKVRFFLKKKPGLADWQYGILQAPIVQKKLWEPIVQKALKDADPVKSLLAADVKQPDAIGGLKFGRWERGAFFENVVNPYTSFRGETSEFFKNGGFRLSNPKLNFKWATTDPTPSGEVTLKYTEGPYVDNVIYRIYQNQNAAVLALLNGEVSYIFNSLGLQRGFQTQLQANPNVEIIRNNTNGFRYLSFNMRREPFSIKEFRQAIATLIDRDFVTKDVLQGVAFPLATVVPPGNAFWYNPEVKIWGQGMTRGERVQAAMELLKKAGFKWRKEPVIKDAKKDQYEPGEGLLLPNGEPVKPFEMLAPAPGYDPLRATFALWIERWVADLGIPLRVRLTDFNTISSKVYDEQDFDMYMLGWSLALFPDHIYLFFHSSQAEAGGFNAGGYNNPEFDKVAEALKDASDLETARKYAFEGQRFLAEEVPYIVLFDTPVMEAYRKDQVKYPYTQVLGGLQYVYGLQATVQLMK